MQILRSYWIYLLGGLLGAIGGYLYWRYIGCNTGACPITSSPIISALYGSIMGVLLGGSFKKDEVKNK